MAKQTQPVVAAQKNGTVATVDDRMREQSAVKTLAERMGVEPTTVFMAALKNVAFKSPNVSTDQLMALVVVSNQYKLNPFTRELYAFPDRGGGIVPIVSVDGWFRIINEHPQNAGIEYKEIEADGKLVAGEVTIHRGDRTHSTVIREYLSEVRRDTDPWRTMPRRMLRHKTIIQGARVAFGFAGIFEPDEAERIIGTDRVVQINPTSGAEAARALLQADPSETLTEKKEPVTAPETTVEREPGSDDDDGQESLPV